MAGALAFVFLGFFGFFSGDDGCAVDDDDDGASDDCVFLDFFFDVAVFLVLFFMSLSASISFSSFCSSRFSSLSSS